MDKSVGKELIQAPLEKRYWGMETGGGVALRRVGGGVGVGGGGVMRVNWQTSVSNRGDSGLKLKKSKCWSVAREQQRSKRGETGCG